MPEFDALWDFTQPEDTEKRFTDLLPAVTAAGDLDATLQLNTQIARALGLQQRFGEAHATLDAVHARLTEATPIAHTRYYLERGRLYNSAGQPSAALPYFHQAVQSATDHHDDGLLIDGLHMLAIADDRERHVDWNMQALAIAQHATAPDAVRWQGSLYNNLGWSYFDQGDYPQALDIFTQALYWREQQGKLKETLIARWCVARTLRAMNQPAAALSMQMEIRTAWLAAQETPDGYGSEEIAECLLALDQTAAARPYFAEAYARFSANGTLADQPSRLARIKTLAADS